jgi:hypothetical protein
MFQEYAWKLITTFSCLDIGKASIWGLQASLFHRLSIELFLPVTKFKNMAAEHFGCCHTKLAGLQDCHHCHWPSVGVEAYCYGDMQSSIYRFDQNVCGCVLTNSRTIYSHYYDKSKSCWQCPHFWRFWQGRKLDGDEIWGLKSLGLERHVERKRFLRAQLNCNNYRNIFMAWLGAFKETPNEERERSSLTLSFTRKIKYGACKRLINIFLTIVFRVCDIIVLIIILYLLTLQVYSASLHVW